MGSWGLKVIGNKINNLSSILKNYDICILSKKIKKHMEYELSVIFNWNWLPKMVFGSSRTHFMYMWVKVTFTSIRQYNKSIKCYNRVLMSRKYVCKFFVFKLFYSILFPNLWKLIALTFELLQVIFEHVLNQEHIKAYKSCYFSINTVFLTKGKAIIGSLR